MANLKTNYLGLELKNPVIVGASSLVSDVENLNVLKKLALQPLFIVRFLKNKFSWKGHKWMMSLKNTLNDMPKWLLFS